MYGINSQLSKRDALLLVLPEDVIDECKPLLGIPEDLGYSPYRDIKKEILNIYGKKQKDAYTRAKSRQLTGQPSALGKQSQFSLMWILCGRSNCRQLRNRQWLRPPSQRPPTRSLHTIGVVEVMGMVLSQPELEAETIEEIEVKDAETPTTEAATISPTPTPPTPTTPLSTPVPGIRTCPKPAVAQSTLEERL